MKLTDALVTLSDWDRRGRYVFSTGDLARIFREPRNTARLSGTITRLCNEGILSRPTRGVYVYRHALSLGDSILPYIAMTARRGCICIEALETGCSKWGLISQAYAHGLTALTTGRSGSIECEWGNIRLVHTVAQAHELLSDSVYVPDIPMRLGSKDLCYHSLRRSKNTYAIAIEYESRRSNR